GRREFLDGFDQRFRHEPAAEITEVSALVRIAASEDGLRTPLAFVHTSSRSVAAASAAKNSRMRVGLLMPGDSSTPDETSMAQGRTVAIAAATLAAVSPPASTMGLSRDSRAACVQSAVLPVPPRRSGSLASMSGITVDGHSATRSTAPAPDSVDTFMRRAPTSA